MTYDPWPLIVGKFRFRVDDPILTELLMAAHKHGQDHIEARHAQYDSLTATELKFGGALILLALVVKTLGWV